ncbi:MAG: hypothetical protein IRY92_00425, partial [Dactylosporangium sp.]|nr:hypothetical protein [Dactylosporangium sp.]
MKTGIAFRGADDGFASGSSNSAATWLYGTSDGGGRWTPLPLALPPGVPSAGGVLTTFPPVFDDRGRGLLAATIHGDDEPSVVAYRSD